LSLNAERIPKFRMFQKRKDPAGLPNQAGAFSGRIWFS